MAFRIMDLIFTKINKQIKRNKMKKIIYLIMSLILISSVLAVSKPAQQPDPFKVFYLTVAGTQKLTAFDIAPPPSSIVGRECTNLYSTTGDYCSGHLRVYYQCLPHLDGNWYEQRTENCKDYDGRCSVINNVARCTDMSGTSPYSRNLFITGLIVNLLLIGGGLFLAKKTENKNWYGLIILGILALILTIAKIQIGGI